MKKEVLKKSKYKKPAEKVEKIKIHTWWC